MTCSGTTEDSCFQKPQHAKQNLDYTSFYLFLLKIAKSTEASNNYCPCSAAERLLTSNSFKIQNTDPLAKSGWIHAGLLPTNRGRTWFTEWPLSHMGLPYLTFKSCLNTSETQAEAKRYPWTHRYTPWWKPDSTELPSGFLLSSPFPQGGPVCPSPGSRAPPSPSPRACLWEGTPHSFILGRGGETLLLCCHLQAPVTTGPPQGTLSSQGWPRCRFLPPRPIPAICSRPTHYYQQVAGEANKITSVLDKHILLPQQGRFCWPLPALVGRAALWRAAAPGAAVPHHLMAQAAGDHPTSRPTLAGGEGGRVKADPCLPPGAPVSSSASTKIQLRPIIITGGRWGEKEVELFAVGKWLTIVFQTGSPQMVVSGFFLLCLNILSPEARACPLWLLGQVGCACPRLTWRRQVGFAGAGLETTQRTNLPLSGPEYAQPEQEKSIWHKMAGTCKGREWKQPFVRRRSSPCVEHPRGSSLAGGSANLCCPSIPPPGPLPGKAFCFRRAYLYTRNKYRRSDSQ